MFLVFVPFETCVFPPNSQTFLISFLSNQALQHILATPAFLRRSRKNEVGKTFRKLICNYENAHTSSGGIDLTLPSFSWVKRHRKGCCMWFENYMLFQRSRKGKVFVKRKSFLLDLCSEKRQCFLENERTQANENSSSSWSDIWKENSCVINFNPVFF